MSTRREHRRPNFLIVGAPILVLLLLMMTMGGTGDLSEFLFMSNPLALVGWAPDYLASGEHGRGDAGLFAAVVVWLGVYGGVTLYRLIRLPALYRRSMRTHAG